jgi:hypothetical protein
MRAGRIVFISAATTVIGTWLVNKFGRGSKIPGFSR